MSAVAATVILAGAVAVQRTCRWTEPGRDRYTGDVPAAMDHYGDIPPAIRDRLKERLAAHAYDDLVTVTRDSIDGEGGHAYEPGIREMHFGNGRVCREVSRKAWPESRRVLGMVYCEQSYCVMVPTVCGNLSRINRRPDDLDINPAAGPPAAGSPVPQASSAATPLAPQEVLAAEPPSAGLPAAVLPPVVQVGPPLRHVFPPELYPPAPWPWPYLPPIVTLPPRPVAPPAVPEPASTILALLGVGVLWAVRHGRQARIGRGSSAGVSGGATAAE